MNIIHITKNTKHIQFAGYTLQLAPITAALDKYNTATVNNNNGTRFYRTNYNTCYRTNI